MPVPGLRREREVRLGKQLPHAAGGREIAIGVAQRHRKRLVAGEWISGPGIAGDNAARMVADHQISRPAAIESFQSVTTVDGFQAPRRR
jgi:hypothetical protein